MHLTDEQAEVVAHRGGLLLVQARAGSGKTTTTCIHAKALVEEDGVRPGRILITTFSRQGANDMAAKGVSLNLPWGIKFSTLHGVCLRAMRAAREAACQQRSSGKQPKEFVIIDGGKRWKLNHIIKTALEEEGRRLGVAIDAKKRPAGLSVGDVRGFIATAKASLIAPKSYTAGSPIFFRPGDVIPGMAEWSGTHLGLKPGPARLVARVYARYEKAKRDPYAFDPIKFRGDKGKQFLTFDDMVYHLARGVVLGSAWVEPFRGSYDWVFVDEVQDNSLGQWAVARHLSNDENLVAIGDDMQSIYGFRGAVPKLMRRYLVEAGAKMLTLRKNFRSRAGILELANRVLAAATDGLSDAVMVPGLADAHLPADIGIRGYTDPTEQGEVIAEQIEGRLLAGEHPSGIAILYRTNAQSGPLELAFLKRGIRYRIAGSSFFNRAEVKTAICYLRLALNPADLQAYERVYCVPLRGIGRVFLDAYPSYPELLDVHHSNQVKRKFARGARNLVTRIDEIKARLADEKHGLADALRYIDEELGVRAHYRDEDAPDDDITTVDESMQALIDCASTLKDVRKLVAYAIDMDGTRVEDGEGTEERPMVTLSTAHRSKGLEWETLYIVGVTSKVFPHAMADPAEELRLFYVALTRAKKTLRVSYTAYRLTGSKGGPSSAVMLAGLLAEAYREVETYVEDGMNHDPADDEVAKLEADLEFAVGIAELTRTPLQRALDAMDDVIPLA